MSALERKIAMITGASTGIGRATAIEYARHQYDLIALGRNIKGLQETQIQCARYGSQFAIVHCDLADLFSVFSAIDHTIEEIGPIDSLANIAGVWHDDEQAYHGLQRHEWTGDKIIEVMMPMVISAETLSAAVAGLMRPGSTIVNVSCYFQSGEPEKWGFYYDANTRIEERTKLHAELFSCKNIRVNCVAPGFVASEACIKHFPAETSPDTALLPSEVAQKIYWYASPESAPATGKIHYMGK